MTRDLNAVEKEIRAGKLSRRSFCFLGLGVLASGALDPWAPVRAFDADDFTWSNELPPENIRTQVVYLCDGDTLRVTDKTTGAVVSYYEAFGGNVRVTVDAAGGIVRVEEFRSGRERGWR